MNKWYKIEANKFDENHIVVEELISLSGKKTDKMAYTYIALCDSKNSNVVHYYYIFLPNETYKSTLYNINIPFVYIRDYEMNITDEFINYIKKNNILKYDNNTLLEPSNFIMV